MIITKKAFKEALEAAKKEAAEEVYKHFEAEERHRDDAKCIGERFEYIDRRLNAAFADISRRLDALERKPRYNDEPVFPRY